MALGVKPSAMSDATAKAFNSKLGISINIKHYGAVGDGVTDDTASIQSAIDAVNTAGGGTVLIPIGVFITDTLTLYSNIAIRGLNRNKSILKWIDAPAAIAMFQCIGTSGNYKTGISFENLTIKHINTISSGEKRLINAQYTSYCVVEDCVFTDFSYSAITISETESSTKSWMIRNNIFKNGRTSGARGVNLRTNGEYVSILGNLFEHIAWGVYIEDAANTLISGNQITYAYSGIFISQTTAGTNNGKTIITNNQINHAGVHGIYGYLMRANADRGVIISNNQLLFNYSYGILLKGAYSSVITGNRVSQSMGTDKGISIEDFATTQISDYNIISSNIVTVGSISVTATGTHNVVEHNIDAIP